MKKYITSKIFKPEIVALHEALQDNSRWEISNHFSKYMLFDIHTEMVITRWRKGKLLPWMTLIESVFIRSAVDELIHQHIALENRNKPNRAELMRRQRAAYKKAYLKGEDNE